jgi:hypothetical protein
MSTGGSCDCIHSRYPGEQILPHRGGGAQQMLLGRRQCFRPPALVQPTPIGGPGLGVENRHLVLARQTGSIGNDVEGGDLNAGPAPATARSSNRSTTASSRRRSTITMSSASADGPAECGREPVCDLDLDNSEYVLKIENRE